MLVLGIESSCDETAAAVVEDGRRVRSDIVASQVALHQVWGGVVPEIASRAHVQGVVPVITEALAAAGCTLGEIDGIAVTRGPGLAGALLVGVQTAKAIAWARGIPLVGVHHLEGHLSAVYLHDADERPPEALALPHLALLVSGGHTALVRVTAPGRYALLGSTRDDAAGEAFDKVAKMLGLGYPGGALVDQLAAKGDERAVALPKSMRRHDLEFSFSGLKTAMAAVIAARGVPTGQVLFDLCASFQRAVVEQLRRKTELALDQTGLLSLQVTGGVAANSAVRRAFAEVAGERGVRLLVPPPRRCTDNAAMIAAAGYHRLLKGERQGPGLSATASWPLDEAHLPHSLDGGV